MHISEKRTLDLLHKTFIFSYTVFHADVHSSARLHKLSKFYTKLFIVDLRGRY